MGYFEKSEQLCNTSIFSTDSTPSDMSNFSLFALIPSKKGVCKCLNQFRNQVEVLRSRSVC